MTTLLCPDREPRIRIHYTHTYPQRQTDEKPNDELATRPRWPRGLTLHTCYTIAGIEEKFCYLLIWAFSIRVSKWCSLEIRKKGLHVVVTHRHGSSMTEGGVVLHSAEYEKILYLLSVRNRSIPSRRETPAFPLSLLTFHNCLNIWTVVDASWAKPQAVSLLSFI